MGLFGDRKAAVSIGVIALIAAFMLVTSTLTVLTVNFSRYSETVKKSSVEVQLKQAEKIKVIQVDSCHVKIKNYGQHPILITKLVRVNPNNKQFEVMGLDSPVAIPPLEEKTVTLPKRTAESWEVGALTSRGNLFWETFETGEQTQQILTYQGTVSAGDVYRVEGLTLTKKTQGLIFFDDFERSTLRDAQCPWSTGGGSYSGEGDWYTTTEKKKYGSRSVCSNPEIDDRETSWIRITITMPKNGYIRFWWSVSSENGFDYLRFYDNGRQKAVISGYVNWKVKEFTLSSGSHTIEFKYTKDGSVTIGQDKGWVDQVYVWIGGKTITIQNVKAEDIIKIYDSSGNVVKQVMASTSTVNIDVSNLISQDKLPIFNGKVEVISRSNGKVDSGKSEASTGNRGDGSESQISIVDFIYDTFSSGLDGWSYWGYKSGVPGYGYSLSWDYSIGHPAPSAIVYELSGAAYFPTYSTYHSQQTPDRLDGTRWIRPSPQYGFGDAGMQKTVDISRWTGNGPLILSFNWRAKSDYSGSTVTNANLKILDSDTGKQLYYEKLFAGGSYDTGWRSFSRDISSYVRGSSRIKIILYFHDVWVANWQQKNWYDNIRLYGEAYI